MGGAIPPLPNTPSWRGVQAKEAQEQLYLTRLIIIIIIIIIYYHHHHYHYCTFEGSGNLLLQANKIQRR
jgi:hypothetical protein